MGCDVTNMQMIPTFTFIFHLNSKDAIDVMNWYLDSVMRWMKVNKLKLNPNKRGFLG